MTEPAADVLVEAGLMTDVPPCSCGRRFRRGGGRETLDRNCVHHGPEWIRIRERLAESIGSAA
ncbi:hypothetical protein [Mycolicibacter heraklionensis]|uniref:hypothetical protein n=1 Tax=Mycolicibacter heraklionensis TaxID=512402 RepID=UPI0007EC0C40|nr:hypothetical protein [Mycolicibacter heraklionensis]OBG32437.1 hypothetical protein A5671_07865 [Mycolicibacter heraklionensis]